MIKTRVTLPCNYAMLCGINMVTMIMISAMWCFLSYAGNHIGDDFVLCEFETIAYKSMKNQELRLWDILIVGV